MTPDGAIRARIYETKLSTPVALVMKAGQDIATWWDEGATDAGPTPLPLAFTANMHSVLSRLSVCIVGVSGTGSVVAEQLARLGFGEIILIDFDRIEERNLNRILNSTLADVGRLKVDVFAEAIRRYRPEVDVHPVPHSIATRDAVLAASEADILFSCVDTAEGRHIADRLSASFAMPLFDVGVSIPTKISANGIRRIVEAYGRVDYVCPGGSSLMDRGVYDAPLLEMEYLTRVAPNALAGRVEEGYLKGVAEQAPGVIALNMRAASACVLECIARLFPFRQFANEARVRSIFMLSEGDEDVFAEGSFSSRPFPVARGAAEPLLGLPMLAEQRRAA